MDGRLAIHAAGAGGASGLIRRTAFSPRACRDMRWTWMVKRLQPAANLKKKGTDDVAAAIFILFGDPGFLSDPDPVPTLRYVWTGEAHRVGDVIANPYMPKTVRNIVVRAGTGDLGEWTTENRDLIAGFRAAFGRSPDGDIGAVAIFVDNDQTKEPVQAYFQEIAVAGAPSKPSGPPLENPLQYYILW